MLEKLKRFLQLLLELDKLATEFENKYKPALNVSSIRTSIQIYNTFTHIYYNQNILYTDLEGKFINDVNLIKNQTMICFDILTKRFKTMPLAKYKNFVVLDDDNISLYEICANESESSLFLVSSVYVYYKVYKLKKYNRNINILDSNLLKLYQSYKNDVLNHLRNKTIILNIKVSYNDLTHLYAKKNFIVLSELIVKSKIYLDQLKNNERKIYNDLRKLKIMIHSLIEKHYQQKLTSHFSITAYKYRISENIVGFIIDCEFEYIDILDLILYVDFIDTIVKS